ncbi:Hybrid signal transduction histidine kinase B [Lachnellula suecica]|uniref:Hybrid signal transduction histidine kinase B n=1 Tax=Lachnellula suecica TaxID=602035 RepID=A0A8T9C562_9HELO|nr:Hybrid signal transduction histidine kinase B [Lachnellula suecica]
MAMPMPMPMPTAAQVRKTQQDLERARVREVARYYNPKKKNFALKQPTDDPATTCDGPFNSEEPEDDRPPDETQALVYDPTLTAFAQLGAFRTNCERSFISIMDGKNQFILAEATRSVSLTSRDKYEGDEDEIFLGPTALTLQWGVCPHTIQVFTATDTSLDIDTPNVYANRDQYVMNDMSVIEQYKDRPYIVGKPYMKFYAEVPMRSPGGHVIGTYCVVDNKPRDGLDKKSFDALNEIATAIMNHIELVRTQRSLHRAMGMMKGLAQFVEGKGKFSDWVEAEGSQSKLLRERPSMERTGTAETLSSNQLSETILSDKLVETTEPISENTTLQETPSSTVRTNTSKQASRERKMSMEDVTISQESIASVGINQLFARACDLIREALDLDGAMIVDACFRDIAVDQSKPVSILAPSSKSLRFAADREAWLDGDTSEENATRQLDKSYSTEALPIRPDFARRSSDLLGVSIHNTPKLRASSSARQVPLSQSTLRGLLQKYPHGHLYDFDEHGLILKSADALEPEGQQAELDAPGTSPSELEAEKLWINQLLEVCPGARSIIFLALWDPQRDQWFAGCLAWTTDPNRSLEAADIPYLAAFGSSIMSEKSRLDALTADRAKADFISSVSHELRTPLHGVLASAEALQETSAGLVQDDLIRTITICGELLVDTMDQILDYTKTSRATVSPESRLTHLTPAAEIVTSLELSSLIENVVAGVSAGHKYRKSGFRTLKEQGATTQQKATLNCNKDDVRIILSIERSTSFILKSQVTSWKMILTNLVGNAFKYTLSGFVHVSLLSSTSSGMTLRVEDTGKGMSKDYLKHQLFTPFVQEDPHAVGTGLGLSIVFQLVADVGGKIDVQSEIGYGTTVDVYIPTSTLSASVDTLATEEDHLISSVRKRCHGLKLGLLGFEHYPDIRETPSGILDSQARCMLGLKKSFLEMAQAWFGLEVITATSLQSTGDILLVYEPKWNELGGQVPSMPLIVLEDTTAKARISSGNGLFSLTQPVGPHKLAKILASCLDHIAFTFGQQTLNGAEHSSAVPSPLRVYTPPIANQETNYLEGATVPQTDRLDDLSLPIRLPVQTDQEKVTMKTETQLVLNPKEIPPGLPIAARSRVLLVEDNAINMKILVNHMKRAAQNYVCATNGLEALQDFKAEPQSFKVIFMDLSMPIMDGLTSTRHIRAFENEKSLPRTRIVALTCFSSADYQRDASLSGIDHFFVKPVPMKTLRPILELDPDVFGTNE